MPSAAPAASAVSAPFDTAFGLLGERLLEHYVDRLAKLRRTSVAFGGGSSR